MKEDFLPDPSVAVSLSTRIRKRISTPKEDALADAAEDLLAALQDIVSLWERVHEKNGPVLLGRLTVQTARAAIAKATANP